MTQPKPITPVAGGGEAHKDLNVAAAVDTNDQVLETQSFATTRQSYKLVVVWMRSLRDLKRIGIKCTGRYGAGFLRYMKANGVDVLEVTTPGKLDRRRRGKNNHFDAQSAAHALFAKRDTVTARNIRGELCSAMWRLSSFGIII